MDKNFNSHSKIWLTWESQPRNRSLSKQFDAVLFEKDVSFSPFLRYPYLILWTIQLLLRNKSEVVFVQNPSLILSFVAVVVAKIIQNKTVIVDAHNIALESVGGFWKFLEILRKFVIKHASFTIVSNDGLINQISIWGGLPLVLADPLPEYDSPGELALEGESNILYICSWADDEPYCEVLKAASLLDKSIKVYISGNSKNKYKNCACDLPDNVELTGFMDIQKYEDLLHSVDVIVDLTTRDDCLLCGAYEGVSAEKPMVLSNTKALKKYFYKGAVYTDNTAIDIAEKINLLLNEQKYSNEIIELKNEVLLSWEKSKLETVELVGLCNRG